MVAAGLGFAIAEAVTVKALKGQVAVRRLRPTVTPPTIATPDALRLRHEPAANCARYDTLRSTNSGTT